MKISPVGIALEQHFETCVLAAYPDPASDLGKACTAAHLLMSQYKGVPGWATLDGAPWTAGWGHTGPEVLPGLVISLETANAWQIADNAGAESDVEEFVKVELTQGQFDALVSFTYNEGPGRLKTSTLLQLVNKRIWGQLDLDSRERVTNATGAVAQFSRWDIGGGHIMPGLVTRRDAEARLFAGYDWRGAVRVKEMQHA